MRTKLIVSVGALALTLTACMTTEQKAANMQAEVDQMMRIYGPACTRLGYPAQSDQWRSCVMQLSLKEEVERAGHPSYYASFGRRHWGLGGMWGPYW